MSWFPGITAPLAAWLFALLVPLVVFYFLKLQRPRLEIPSLALWRSVIEDQRVNSPFQKFKRNLLLLLQAAVLCLLALAAMQPFIRGGAERATYLPILIDCSASMAATDADGRTRLDLAKSEVRTIIDNLLPDQRVTLVAVSDSAQRLTEFTNNRRVLLDALTSVTVDDVPSRPEEGLQLAQALARTFDIGSVRFYSDGNLPVRPDPNGKPMAVVDFDLPFELQFHKLPAAAANIGITAFNARKAGPDRWDVFVRIEGSGVAQTAANVELLANDVPVGRAESVVLEAGQSQRLVFRYDGADAASLEVRLRPDGADSLATDNVAFLELPVSRPLSVYCPADLVSFRHSLEVLGDIELLPQGEVEPQRATYDLVITDNAQDMHLDAPTVLTVGVIPEELQRLVRIETGLAEIVDWKRDSGLLQHVLFSDVDITDLPTSEPNVGDGDFESLGYEILAHGSAGPLVLQRRNGPRLSFHVLFHTDKSTLPYRVGFPVLISNVVALAREQANLSDVRGTTTGILPPLAVKAEQPYRVTGPGGFSVSPTSDADGLLKGIAARTVGSYMVADGNDVVERVGASLLDATETSLLGVDEIHFRELSVAANTTPATMDRPLWPWLALSAFAVLLGEWWLFLRRPGGVPV
ncbi:MAG: BatA and WFA domain-containing protein [Planctomycetaceae bacterium]|nr:BatA and WFA domain-containing protein [Planctomycetaceae bacterium]